MEVPEALGLKGVRAARGIRGTRGTRDAPGHINGMLLDEDQLYYGLYLSFISSYQYQPTYYLQETLMTSLLLRKSFAF